MGADAATGRARAVGRLFPLAALGVALLLTVSSVVLARLVPGQTGVSDVDLFWGASWASYAAVGALVATRRRHPLGGLFLAVGLVIALATALDALTFLVAYRAGLGHPAVPVLRVLQAALFLPGFCLVPLAFLWFPDGVRLTRWRRVVAGLLVTAAVAGTVATLFTSGPVGETLPLDNPWGVDTLDGPLGALGGAAEPLLLVGTLGALVSLAVGAQRAGPGRRAPYLWLLSGVLATVVVATAPSAVGALLDVAPPGADVGPLVAAASVSLVPVSVAVAILRHNLLDLTVVLRRSAVWAGLTAVVVALWLGVAAALSDVARLNGRAAAAAGALTVLATLPVGRRLQAWVDRRVYGDRGQPAVAMERLAQQLVAASDPDRVPAVVVASVRRALRLPYVAILGAGGGAGESGAADAAHLVAQDGVRPPWDLVEVELRPHGREEGRLLLAPPGPGEPLNERDDRLVRGLADQVGLALEGLRLAAEVRASRERTVLAREEERRRLRNDLHDGLGPVLAGVSLTLEALADQLDGPASGTARVAGDRLGTAVADLRRLVDGLRPPALDELGLEGALQALCEDGAALPAVRLVLEPGALDGLAAAVEVAAYRVVAEAVTNARRHARAATVVVPVGRSVAGELQVRVEDDGSGLPAALRPGVGLASMRERCVELGGTCDVAVTGRGGIQVLARWPARGTAAGPP